MSHILSFITHPSTPVLTDTLLDRIANMVDLTQARALNPNIAIDIPLSRSITRDSIAGKLADAPVDINIVPAINRRKKLLIADMDSTMIEQECIDELAAHIGKYDEISQITERAMRGELDFEAALTERVAMLAGLEEGVIEETWQQRIQLTSGGKTLVQTMKARNSFTALVSGGFTPFTQKVADAIGFDVDYANQLEINDGVLTGQVIRPILGREAKAKTLKALCTEQNIDLADTIAVGDGANDLDMLRAAGMGVAFHAKPATAAAADYQINFGDLTALLYLQGIPASEHKF